MDAEGLPPTIPVWFGEAPGRTLELSEEVCSIRREVESRLRAGEADAAIAWLMGAAQIDREPAEQVVRYLAASLAILGTLPTRDQLVIERFFDETGGMQLIVHSPNGARLNRGFGLALRKKFCKNFDFELQAAASDDAVCLSLGPQHSFPLGDVAGFLKSNSVEQTLTQATLVPPSPMFLSRWRWNLNRSLLVLRWKGGRKNPPPIQRMEADDVMAALFPIAAACQENVSGPIELPDHVVVRQTMDDTLREAMDVDGLREMVERIEREEIEIITVDSTEPSPLCHELLVGKAFTFLDDAEAIDRRSRAVPLKRGLPVDLTEIGTVSPEAILEVASQVMPEPASADELFELIESLVVTTAQDAWRPMFNQLVSLGRGVKAIAVDGCEFWSVGSDRTAAAALRPDLWPDDETTTDDRTNALSLAVRGRLDLCATTTTEALASSLGVDRSGVEFALVGLENEGFAIRGNWGARVKVPMGSDLAPPVGGVGIRAEIPATVADVVGAERVQLGKRAERTACDVVRAERAQLWKRAERTAWASRRLLARMHVYSQKSKRARVDSATAQDFMRFLFAWHHVAPGSLRSGVQGLTDVVAQLQGWHAAAASWEPDLLCSRLVDYAPETLDRRSLAGDLTWGRLVTSISNSSRPKATKAMPVTLALRDDLDWLLLTQRPQPRNEEANSEQQDVLSSQAAHILDVLVQRGARFHHQLAMDADLPILEVEQGLWELVWHGHIHADSFHALRSLFDTRRPRGAGPRRRGLRSGGTKRAGGEGRWTVLGEGLVTADRDELAEAVAEQLLARWGVVFHALVATESFSMPWLSLIHI